MTANEDDGAERENEAAGEGGLKAVKRKRGEGDCLALAANTEVDDVAGRRADRHIGPVAGHMTRVCVLDHLLGISVPGRHNASALHQRVFLGSESRDDGGQRESRRQENFCNKLHGSAPFVLGARWMSCGALLLPHRSKTCNALTDHNNRHRFHENVIGRANRKISGITMWLAPAVHAVPSRLQYPCPMSFGHERNEPVTAHRLIALERC